MLIIFTFVLNAGLNFLLGLSIASVLGPDSYGRFSIAFTTATVLTMLLFDWLRLSATRYYNEQARQEQPGLRASLDVSYAAGVVLMLVGVLALVGLRINVGMSAALVAVTGFVAITTGLFEFFGAMLRARFRNTAYSGLVILKNVLAFATMVGAAALTHDPIIVMLMGALSVLAATLALRGQAADPHSRLPHASAGQVAVYLRYGAPIVLANICYQVLILANRSAAAAHLDFAAAGKLSLATDLTLRLMLAVGAALDILLFQLAVHKKATEGPLGAQRQVAANILVVVAVLTLLCVGYMADMPAFAALVAPAKFRADFPSLELYPRAWRRPVLPRAVLSQSHRPARRQDRPGVRRGPGDVDARPRPALACAHPRQPAGLCGDPFLQPGLRLCPHAGPDLALASLFSTHERHRIHCLCGSLRRRRHGAPARPPAGDFLTSRYGRRRDPGLQPAALIC